MAGFPPVRGSGSPFMALLGALGSGLQGYMQGREFKDREQMQQQQLTDDKLKTATDTLPIYQQLSQTTPSLRNDPNFIAGANRNLQSLGVNFQGPVPSTFGGVDPTQLLTNPSFMQWYSAQPRESQQLISQKFGGSLPVADPIDTAPTAQYHFDQMVSQNLNNLGKGEGLTPQAYINWIRTTAPRYGRDPSQYLSDPATIGQLSQVSAAKIDDMVSSGYLKKTTADALKAKLPYQIKQMISGADLNQAKAGAIPVQLQQAQQRIDNEGKKLDLTAQNLQARWAQIDVARQNASTTTLREAQNVYHETVQQWQADQRLRAQYTGQLNTYVSAKSAAPGFDVTTDPQVQALTQRINELGGRIENEHKRIQSFPQEQQQRQNQVLHNNGAPNNMRVAPAGGGHASTPAAVLNGKPIFLKNDGSGYVYADGTPAN